jgi:hypothetical protein
MGWKQKSKLYLLIASLNVIMATFLISLINTATPVLATAGVNSQLSFEGKLVTSSGTNIADGTYNMEFKIYQDGTNTGSGSTLMWTEDYLVAGSSGMPSTGGVSLTSGTFQVNLGAICALSGGTCSAKTNTGVDFNQQTLWLSMQVGNSSSCTITSGVTSFNTACGGDGEMSPYIRLTAVPQAQVAQSANTLGGTLSAANFIQLAQGLQADSSTTNASIAINKTGTTANILTLQRAGTPVLVLSTDGALTLSPSGNNIGTIVRQTSGTATSGNIFDIQGANGTSHFIQVTQTAANAGSISLTALGSNSLTLDAGGGTIVLGSNTTTLQKVAAAFTFDLSNAGTSTLTVSNSNGANVASISATGDIAAGSGRVFKVGATSGSSISACGSTQYVSSFASSGGLVTGGSCTGAVTGLSSAYNTAATTGNTIGLTTAGAGILIQDNASPIGGNLFAVQKNVAGVTYLGVTATGINIQSNFTGSAVNALAFDTSTAIPHLKIYGANGTNYADIYYDSSTSTAYYGANTGTAVLGSGTGAVNVTAGAGAAFTITGNAASSISTTTGNLTLDASSGTVVLGTNTTTVQKAGTSLTLDVNSASASTLTVTNAGAGVASLSVEGGITAGSSGTYTTSGGTATYTSAGASTFTSASGSSLALDSGGTGAINVGTSANAKAIAIGNSQATTTVAVTAGNITATTDQNGFRVANSNGTYSPNLLNIDSTKTNANNLVANPSFEGTVSNWSAVNAGAPSQSSAQVYEGTKSLIIATGTNAGGGGASYSTGTTFLSTATTYTLSAYVKTDSNLLVPTFEMGRMDNGSTASSCLTSQTLPKNGGWERFTCTFTTGTVSGNPAIYFKQTDTVNRNLYIDDILLQTDANSDENYRNAAIDLTGSTLTGPFILQNASNSTNALTIQNANGSTIFNVDTTDSNLISTSGFESNATGWTAAGASTTIVRDSNNAYLGSYSLKIVTSVTADSGAQFTINPVVTAASTNYTISFFARRASGDATAFTDLIARYSADGTTTAGHFSDCGVTAMNSQTVLNTGWTRYYCTVSSATTPTTSGYILIKDTAGAAHTWYIDGVQLEQASTVSAYGAGAVSLNGVITSPVVFKGSANATTAFQIQNSSSLNMLGVDTINSYIQIGSSTSDANAIQLVLDSLNTAADPTTTINGAMYYNTNQNVFRCRENGIWKNCIDPPSNASTADQSPAAATLTYLTGSSINIPQGGVRVGSQFVWRMSVSKTAAGTLAPTFAVVFGTNGTTADTARASFTLPVETATIDAAQITVICTVRSVSTTATISCNLQLVHNDANATGFVGTATSGSIVLSTTSATFDDTIASSIIGLTVNSNTANLFTFQQVQAQAINL